MATEHIPSSSTLLRGCQRAGAGGWNWCRRRLGRTVHERPLAVQLVSGLSLLLVVAAAACCLAIIPLGTPESKAGAGGGWWSDDLWLGVRFQNTQVFSSVLQNHIKLKRLEENPWRFPKVTKRCLHCIKNLIYVFPEMKLCGFIPNSYIHVSITIKYFIFLPVL